MQLIGQSLRLALLNSTLIGIWKVPHPSVLSERTPGPCRLADFANGIGERWMQCVLYTSDGSDPIGRSLYVNGQANVRFRCRRRY